MARSAYKLEKRSTNYTIRFTDHRGSRKRLVAQAPEEEAALLARAEDELAHR